MAPAVAANPEVFHRFAEALHESSEYTNSHLPETVDLVASYTHLTPEVVARSVRIVDGDYVEAKNIQPVIDILVKYGMTDKTFPAQELVSSAAVKSR
jgi:ABC-type nitrate/sulfonate/bicarbonate transport system substrate-binding protein